MLRLLPPLEMLSQMHPEVVIQELAFDLRGVIATHGAYRPDNISESSTSSAFRRNQKMPTEANDSQTPPRFSSTDSLPPSGSKTIHPASTGRSAEELGLRDGRMTSGTSEPQPHTNTFSDLLLEAFDPDVPTRAVALRSLTHMVQNEKPEAAQAREKILMVGCFNKYFVSFFFLVYELNSYSSIYNYIDNVLCVQLSK